MKKLLAVIISTFLAGCASVGDKAQSIATAKETFAVCRAADTATTLVILHHGGAELNPIMAPLVHSPLLFMAVQIAAVVVVWHYWDSMTVETKGILNVVGCLPAAHNLGQL